MEKSRSVSKDNKIKRISKRSEKIGLPPGALVFLTDKPKEEAEKISKIQYNQDTYRETKLPEITREDLQTTSNQVTWIDIQNYSPETVKIIADDLNLHPLILEDILTSNQRPKIEESENLFVLFLQLISWDTENYSITNNQAILLIHDSLVISFTTTTQPIFNNIIERLEKSKGKIRSMKEDYLLYTLTDLIVDNYFIVIENLQDQIEKLEDKIDGNMEQNIAEEIRNIRWQAILARKSIWPVREVINKLLRQNSNFISETTQIYFRDIQDHIVYILESLESHRELISGLRDSHVTAISNRMNQIINVLTIISSIFIPISFLAGLYGMNFINIPELQNENGYFILIGAMICIVGVMLYFFRKKKWF